MTVQCIHRCYQKSLPSYIFLLITHLFCFTSVDSFRKHAAVKCSLKANEGWLYPVDRGFLFIHKPPTFIRYADISALEFARINSQAGQSGSRNFDLVVTSKSGTEYQFTNIDR